jgi:hypothetical protein
MQIRLAFVLKTDTLSARECMAKYDGGALERAYLRRK